MICIYLYIFVQILLDISLNIPTHHPTKFDILCNIKGDIIHNLHDML